MSSFLIRVVFCFFIFSSPLTAKDLGVHGKLFPIEEESLLEYIKRRLQVRQYSGSRGTITTFLEPSVKHGDTVKIISRKFPEKEGDFLVKKVIKNFGLNGGRQEVTLSQKL